LQDDDVDGVEVEPAEPGLDEPAQEEPLAHWKMGQHDDRLVAVPGQQVAQGDLYLATLEEAEVEVVQVVFVEGLLDGGRGHAIARGDAQPADHQPSLTQRYVLSEIHTSPAPCNG